MVDADALLVRTAEIPHMTQQEVDPTPHMAAHSKAAMVKMATYATQGVIEVLNKWSACHLAYK